MLQPPGAADHRSNQEATLLEGKDDRASGGS
uniref:Uncharacterized protein n=1 Tax=Arundo donax TaxID=35708 RepID=A0A0A9G2G7_ARUDO